MCQYPHLPDTHTQENNTIKSQKVWHWTGEGVEIKAGRAASIRRAGGREETEEKKRTKGRRKAPEDEKKEKTEAVQGEA